MYYSESVLEKTDHLISARRADLVVVNKTTTTKKKQNLPNSGLCRLDEPQSENKSKRKER